MRISGTVMFCLLQSQCGARLGLVQISAEHTWGVAIGLPHQPYGPQAVGAYWEALQEPLGSEAQSLRD